MGVSMINRTFVETSLENIQKIKESLLSVSPYKCEVVIEQVTETKIKLSCGGKCGGHVDEILEIVDPVRLYATVPPQIKLISQHINMDEDDFYIYYYSKDNVFGCYFDYKPDNTINYDYMSKLSTEEINILLNENIFSIVDGRYVDNENFPFCRKTR